MITAHPDDLEIGCAGTLVRMQQEGHQITSVITVRPSAEDRAARDRPTVESELHRSYAQSDFELHVFATDLHDNGRPNLKHDNVTMARLWELIEPCDLCILPNPEDYHQEHQITFALAYPAALRRSRVIWTMHSWPYCYHYTTSKPNLFRDISLQWSAKQAMLRCYPSYFDDGKIGEIQRLNQVWGDQNRSYMAEAFTVLKDSS